VIQEHKVLLVQEPKELKDLMDRKELKDLTEHKELMEHKDP
jgi:hypothetical protein